MKHSVMKLLALVSAVILLGALTVIPALAADEADEAPLLGAEAEVDADAEAEGLEDPTADETTEAVTSEEVEDDTTAEDTTPAYIDDEDPAASAGDTTAEETTVAAEDTGVSDVSNIIGIVVAVVIGVGAIVAVVLLAPKNVTKKK